MEQIHAAVATLAGVIGGKRIRLFEDIEPIAWFAMVDIRQILVEPIQDTDTDFSFQTGCLLMPVLKHLQAHCLHKFEFRKVADKNEPSRFDKSKGFCRVFIRMVKAE
jgi:hypothetical protein